MPITRIENQILPQGLGRDPDVIGRNWSALSFQVRVNFRVQTRSFGIKKQDTGMRAGQELLEALFVFAAFRAAKKSRTKFAERDNR